ncbi:MAG: efflux RND transporter permease subunit, partial [Holophaga sp.]|nr:efflux RND transporter permease subunit [Holophaga sp.]
SVAVPLSLVGTFSLMYALDYSLNNLTLMALTIATGFVVDDAIVMIENISRYLELGLKPMDAALKGAEEIGFTILSLTVSLIAVLIPLLFMSDITGRLFREFAVTLAITILLSAVVSLTLTPMMASRLLRHTPAEQQGRFYRWSETVFERVIGAYGRSLTWVLGRQKLVLGIAALTILATGWMYVAIPKGFFPIQDTGLVQAITQAPEATSFDAMTTRQRALAQIVLQDPAVQSLSSFIGVDGTNTTLNSGRMQIELKPLAARGVNASEVIQRLRPQLAKVPGIQTYLMPVQDLTVEDRISRTQFQYTVEDADSAELETWTARILAKLKTLPQLQDVVSDQQPNGNALSVDIDRVTASRLGITPQALDDTLDDAFGQRQISTLYTQTNQYHVILETDPRYQGHPDQIQNIYLQGSSSSNSSSSSSGSATGSQLTTSSTSGVSSTTATSTSRPIPLAAFTTVKPTLAPLTINHQSQFPVVTLSFNLAPGVHLSQAVDAVKAAERGLKLPVGVETKFQGTAASYENSLSNEGMLLLAALAAVYIVLGVLYESFIHPLTILSTLPAAGVGALVALALCGQDLGIVGIIGIVLLIGIVKKNGIMMVDFALQAERAEGKPPREAIYEACLLRFRPIMMTTFAALFAGLPLALGTGIGAELRRPLGIAMVGGLLLSQVLTLYTTPVIYLWFDRLSRHLRPGSKLPAGGAE